ncbi:hypothetical protein GINT2_001937 [Glugoides intestinalis]
MRFSIVLIASTLISCRRIFRTEESLKRLENLYGKMPTNKKERVSFAKSIDSILENVPLEDPVVFNMYAPFLLYSEKYNYMLNGMDLRLVYESNNENLKNDWKNHADKKVESLRCSFDIVEINDDEGLKKKIKFCKNFSNLTNVEVSYGYSTTFDKNKTWNNLMKALPKLSSITEGGTDVELLLFDSVMLKDFIDGAAASKSEALQHLNKLKIVFKDDSGIRYINSAVENFSSLFKYLPNLSEITIENEAEKYKPGENPMSDKLVNLIKKLPTDRKIEIKLIGRFIELNETPEFFNALKKRSDTGNKVSIVYKFDSFSKEDALSLRNLIEHSKLAITIFGTSNGIERQLPSTIEFLDKLLKVKSFSILFGYKFIKVEHTSVNDFLSSFNLFQEWKWELVEYTDNNPRTEIRELLAFVKAFKKYEYISFKSNFLEFNNKKNMKDFISVVNEPDKRFILNASTLLIDSKNLITIYNKMQENENFTVKSNSWLIRVRKGKMGDFKQKFEEIYKKLYPKWCEEDQFLDKIKALSELDAFTIDLSNKDVLYIGNGNFDPIFRMLPTIKNMFKEVFIAKDAFTVVQIKKLRKQLRNGGSCTLEKGTEEFLLPPQLRRQ